MSDTTVRVIDLADTALVSEEELLGRARSGDKSAFGALFLRHREAARKVAGMCAASAADAEDAVAEGFARVFAALPRMAGRDITFRPYLLTAVRNAATDRLRRERRVDLRDAVPDAPDSLQADEGALLDLERNLVGEALQALPSRWRTVLWLTEVEGLSPAEVSRRIGLKPNAVAALAYRARKGLREAYLQAHLRVEVSEECRATVARLGNYVRGELPEKERLLLQAHLDECAKCRCRRDELTDVNATLRNAFLPVPLLLAGAQRRWWSVFDGNALLAQAPDVASVAQMADNPLLHKTVAGVTMMVLAITGAAVPQVVDRKPAQPKVAQAVTATEKGDGDIRLDVARVLPRELAVSAVADPAPAADPSGTVAAGSTETAAGGTAGEGRSRLIPGFGRYPHDGAERRGDTRQRLLRPPGSSDPEDGLIPIAPLAGVVDSTVESVNALTAGVEIVLTSSGLLTSPDGDERSAAPAPDTGGAGESPDDASGGGTGDGEAQSDPVTGVVETVRGVLEPIGGLLGLNR